MIGLSLSALLLLPFALAAPSKREVARLQQDAWALQRRTLDQYFDKGIAPEVSRRDAEWNKTGYGDSTITFANPKAQEFYVDGTSLPNITFDVGPSWSGLMPISSDPNETRKLFFWFWPSRNASLTDDLVGWTNGGPGCSSLEGLTQENGPISWSWGTQPSYNMYSWTNLSHVLWVEQPVGTGFSQGTPNITNEVELAEQFTGFLGQFLNVFSELKGKNFYMTGESYGGYYVPNIANYIYENPGVVDLDLKGIWIADPSLAEDVIQEQIPAFDYMMTHKNLFSLNSSYIEELRQTNEACYGNYTQRYLVYPPAGKLPFPNGTAEVSDECDIFTKIFNAALLPNPAFNIYRISDSYPILWDILGFPGSFPNQQSQIYFNQTDVQKAIHAPQIEWEECSSIDVFVNGTDNSEPTTYSVLPNVIDKSERTVILHGRFDYVLIHTGTQLALQNMTWGGMQGFQAAPVPESLVLPSMGVLGFVQQERKLTYIEVDLSGHMIPQFSPLAGYTSLQYLLGQIDSFPTSP